MVQWLLSLIVLPSECGYVLHPSVGGEGSQNVNRQGIPQPHRHDSVSGLLHGPIISASLALYPRSGYFLANFFLPLLNEKGPGRASRGRHPQHGWPYGAPGQLAGLLLRKEASAPGGWLPCLWEEQPRWGDG